MDFSFTQQEIANKQLEEKFTNLKGEISELAKTYMKREKD